ncbi:MAG: hypothetical protein HY710_08465 [Candidatus Latescibacteria bacterium]|nr:hypothetical protein [Candidatus Latescibacterota bacterium]
MKTIRVGMIAFVMLWTMSHDAWSQYWNTAPGISITNTNTGNVRIGTPDEPGGNKFFVGGTVGIAPNVTNTSKQVVIGFDNTNNYGYVYAYDWFGGAKNLILNNAGGNVGIGTSSPAQRLHVNGVTQATSFYGLAGESRFAAASYLEPHAGVPYDAKFGGSGYGIAVRGQSFFNSAVGIGTTGPAEKLHVIGNIRVTGHYDWYSGQNFRLQGTGEWSVDFPDGDGYDYWSVRDPVHSVILVVRNSGNVGIGTVTPGTALDVRSGSGRVTANALYFWGSGNYTDGLPYARLVESWGMRFQSPDPRWVLSTSNSLLVGYAPNGTNYGAGNVYVQGAVGVGTTSPGSPLTVAGLIQSTAGGFKFPDGSVQTTASTGGGGSTAWQSNGPDLWSTNSGSVGIGTTTPAAAYKLSVKGKIRAEEVVVETGWADFVFAEGYPLPPLSEVEARIRRQGHLPGIPTAAEVQSQGVTLGAMQAKLLQKIEELTLYVIDQQHTLERQHTELAELKREYARSTQPR